ncbi:alpha/beta hydrolase family protein [Streptomyces sp. YIM S03343]
MSGLTLKEKIFYRLVCNEARVYRHWYTRFLLSGVDLERTRRVVGRVHRWHDWCREWYEEGSRLELMAEDALAHGNRECARRWMHEAIGCFHVGQHFFYLDDDIKQRCLEKIWSVYPKALTLHNGQGRPLRADIPFRGTTIPAYLRLQPTPGRPLVVQVNGLDNLKEVEQHAVGQMFYDAGLNTIAFDGPGQGEMWASMKAIPDYHTAVSAVIDWTDKHHGDHIDTSRIGAIGFSMGGYFAPSAAAHDPRITCVVGNCGPADLRFLLPVRRANPILIKGFPHAAGTDTLQQAVDKLGYDIADSPRLDRPLLVLHAGQDQVVTGGRQQAEKFMNWACGEKELKFYPDGEHVCTNYLDEVLPYMVDWTQRHLER